MKSPAAARLLLAGLLVPPLLTAHAGQAARAHPQSAIGGKQSVTAESHGIRLTLAVPRHSYPDNALVRFGLRLENTTNHTIEVLEQPRVCGYPNPGIDVLTAAGQIVYPPALVPFPAMSCPPPIGTRLAPHHAIKRRLLVILRDQSLRGTASLERMAGGTASYFTLQTPRIAVHLVPTAPLDVSLSLGAGTASATITRPAHAAGSLWSEEWTQCRDAGTGDLETTVTSWGRLSSPTITADCAGETLSQWHVVDGWLGYPVATVNDPAPQSHRRFFQ